MLNAQHTLARKLYSEGSYIESISQYQSILFANPNNAEIYLELSSALIANLQYDEALVVAKQAQLYLTENLKISYLAQIGNIYLIQGRFDQAARQFNEIISISPTDLNACIGLSHIYLKQGYPSKAVTVLEYVNSQGQNDARWITNMSLALFNARQTNKAIEMLINFLGSYELQKDSLISNAMMFTSYSEQRDEFIVELSKLIATSRIGSQHESQKKIKSGSPDQDLNIGFVSADFCWHPVGYFLSSFLHELTKYNIKTTLYSNSDTRDSITDQLIKCSSDFKVVKGLSTTQCINLIKTDKIDVLIDLSGHTAGNRLDIFIERAAPLQVSYLGYPDVIGIDNIDYILTDKNHINHSDLILDLENIYYIENSRFCFTPPIVAPDISQSPSLENGYITFGSFGNPSKISGTCLKKWGELLKNLPDSRLKLIHRCWVDTKLQDDLLGVLREMNIPRGRIEFYGHQQYIEYLKLYSQIDFILDTLPFTGGTTTCEALWMGVPVLTIEGLSPASRQSAAILRSLNEDKWIITNENSFFDLIKNIDNDPSVLFYFKKNIRQKLMTSSIGNSSIFAKNFHNSLISMWNKKFPMP